MSFNVGHLSGWTGPGGRVRVDGSGLTGPDGRVRVDRSGWTGPGKIVDKSR